MPEITLKDGRTTTDPRLDRIPHQDEASRNFTVREYLASHPRTLKERRRSMTPGWTLDQGEDGACTGFSIAHAVGSGPFSLRGMTDDIAKQWYYDNQRNDAFPGGEYPDADPSGQQGSTVLASMKTLQQRGIITEYRWIGAGSQSLMADLEQTLKYLGPVNFGTTWYNSMFTPQPNGLLEVDTTSGVAGGHAYCIHNWIHKKLAGTDKGADYIVLQNSWGRSWGVQYGKKQGNGGFAFMRVEDAEALLTEEGGEGAVAIYTKVAES